jgi:hypothetical protein
LRRAGPCLKILLIYFSAFPLVPPTRGGKLSGGMEMFGMIMSAMKMKESFREVKLSVPFRSVCYHCKRKLGFTDRKYINLNIKFGYYCEECKDQL